MAKSTSTKKKSSLDAMAGTDDPRAALDSAALLDASRKVLARLEDDLRQRAEASPAVTRALRAAASLASGARWGATERRRRRLVRSAHAHRLDLRVVAPRPQLLPAALKKIWSRSRTPGRGGRPIGTAARRWCLTRVTRCWCCALSLVIWCVACGPAPRPAPPPVVEARGAEGPPPVRTAAPSPAQAETPAAAPTHGGSSAASAEASPPEAALRGQRDRIALLRALARQAAGVERLDVQHRLCRELLATGQVADLTEAQATLEEMIASAGFAGWARADAALYDLAASRQAARREADALAVWRRLLTEHPTSTYAPDAALALAEAAFVAGELPQAEAGYLRVLGLPGHHTRAYARYKLGWVHLNLGRSSEALADFVEVARTSKDPLRREAIKDVVRVYAELGVAAKALPFLERVDPGHGGALVLRLADSYADIGKLGDAAIAYRAALDVLDPDAGCEAALGLVKVLAAGAQRDEALAAVEALAARRPTGTCGIAAEAVVTELANGWRTEALASRAPELEAIAIRCWELVAQLAQGAPSHRAALAAAAQLRARRP